MRAKVAELEEQLGKELVIFVDGIRIAFPVEFDTEEGWCIAREYSVPHIQKAQIHSSNEVLDGKTEGKLLPVSFKEHTVSGKVQVAFWEESNENPSSPQD